MTGLNTGLLLVKSQSPDTMISDPMGSQISDTMMQCFDLVKSCEKIPGYYSNSNGNQVFSLESSQDQNIANGCHHGRHIIFYILCKLT